MKSIVAQLTYFLAHHRTKRNLKELVRLLLFLLAIMAAFAVIFHALMAWEGQRHSWFSGFYWALVTMSTLGYGDIVFETDVGRAFSMFVILTGVVSLLVVLPFTFIRFFYEPWMDAQSAARAPKQLSEETGGHVILTSLDAVTHSLIKKLDQYGYPYVLLTRDTAEAVRLHEEGFNVVVGALDNPETYQNLRVHSAALVASTSTDMVNTNVAFTVRELSEKVPVITTCSNAPSVDILKLAGSSHVVELAEMMGQSLARRTIGADARAHAIGRFDRLLIAEATAAGTPLVGKTLAESKMRELVGLTVVGAWERGHFEVARPDTRITANTVLVLAGSFEQFRVYNELFCIYHVAAAPVVIIGGGRVGRATGRALAERQTDYRIIERQPDRIRDPDKYVLGNAADLEILEKAGIKEAPTVIITSHDDDTNIYLTIYCRRLRSDIQVISRATFERNVTTLHRAGADFVMSYGSMGANTIFNLLERSDILMVAEGLNIFRVKVPSALARRTIAQTPIRQETGCSIIALNVEGELRINPDPNETLTPGVEMILIGTVEAENSFLKLYGDSRI